MAEADIRERRRGRRWAMKALFMWDSQEGGDAQTLVAAAMRMEAPPAAASGSTKAQPDAQDAADAAEWSEPADGVAGAGASAARAFAERLVAGTLENREVIDSLLESVATSWSLRRMAAVDRAILRLGSYEVMYADTPEAVAVSEAVELAKQYSTADSPRFVNGVLGAVAPKPKGEREGDRATDPSPGPGTRA